MRNEIRLPIPAIRGQVRCGAFHPDGIGCGCWFETGHDGPHGTNLRSFPEYWFDSDTESIEFAEDLLVDCDLDNRIARVVSQRKREDRSRAAYPIRWRVEVALSVLRNRPLKAAVRAAERAERDAARTRHRPPRGSRLGTASHSMADDYGDEDTPGGSRIEQGLRP